MHAEVPAGDGSAVRWVITEPELPCGRLLLAPGRLADLLRGPIRLALVEPHGVTVWLHEEHSWREWGTPVQDALAVALRSVDRWVVAGDRDDVLARIVDDVLAGPVGDYIRSHAGTVRLRRAHDDVVDIELGGACDSCSAMGTTLSDRIETAVRARYPALRQVTRVGEHRQPVGEGRLQPMWPRRR